MGDEASPSRGRESVQEIFANEAANLECCKIRKWFRINRAISVGPVAQLVEHLPYKRCHRFFSLHRLRSIICVINNLGNLLAAHGQPQCLQQTGVLIQF